MDTFTTDPSTTENQLADQANGMSSQAIRSTQAAAQHLLNRVAEGAQQARDQASPVIDRVADKVDTTTRRGIEALRGTSAQLRDKAQQASDVTINYIQQEPIKAVLAAAATGAVLMALVGLLSRSGKSA